MKRELNETLFGNEVCYTTSLILPVKNMLRSKLRCQKGSDLILFSYKHACSWQDDALPALGLRI
jgi:hypothetical protein